MRKVLMIVVPLFAVGSIGSGRRRVELVVREARPSAT